MYTSLMSHFEVHIQKIIAANTVNKHNDSL